MIRYLNIIKISRLMLILILAGIFTCSASKAETDEDYPIIGIKSSIYSLKIGMRYLEHKNNDVIMPQRLPMPLLDQTYFSFGDWAFYCDNYMNEMLRPNLNGNKDRVNLKPLSLNSDRIPEIFETLEDNAFLVKVTYPRHEELERLLQKLYFNLMQGPVILSVAYDYDNIKPGYEQYTEWSCFRNFRDITPGANGDIHLAYVDWDDVHTVVAYLDGGRIRVADRGRIFDVDHNALVAQANAIRIIPGDALIPGKIDRLNYLLYLDNKKTVQAGKTQPVKRH
jgi:hypothetical protein